MYDRTCKKELTPSIISDGIYHLDTVIKVFAHMLQEVSVGGTKAEYVFTGVNPIVSNSSISFVLVL